MPDFAPQLSAYPEPERVARVSLSQLSTWLRCKAKHDYAYRQALVPVSPPSYLSAGSYLHAVLAQALLALQAGDTLPDISELSNRALGHLKAERESGKRPGLLDEGDRQAVNAQLVPFLATLDASQTVEGVELEFLADMGWRDADGQEVAYHGVIDGLVRDSDGALWVVEHKRTSRAWSLGQHQFAYQGRLYAEAVYRLTGERPAGIVYNFFYPKRFATELTYVTPEESQLLVDELGQVVAAMGVTPPVREPHWGCGDCWFRNLCVTEMQGGNAELVRQGFVVDEDKLARYADDTD